MTTKKFIFLVYALGTIYISYSHENLFEISNKEPILNTFQFTENSTATVGKWTGSMAMGSLDWKNVNSSSANFIVLDSIITKEEVASILEIVRNSNVAFDEDLDTVDDMPTYEFYLERNGDFSGIRGISGKSDANLETFSERLPIRERLEAVVRPILSNRIIPFVNNHFSNACGAMNSSCFVCQSLVY